MALQLRRGTNQERLGITLVEGEMVYVTDHAYTSIAVTGLNATTNTLTTTLQHGLTVGDQIKFMGATANGLTAQTVYYVKTVPDVTSFTLSTTSGGTTVDITGTYSAELEFATGPTNGTGAPLGYSVSPLWAGDGVTIGGVAAGSTLLTDLLDVEIGVYGGVGQYGEALADNNIFQYNDSTGQWENRADLTLNGNAYINGDNLYINYDANAVDSSIYFQGTTGRIKYDTVDGRFELNKDLTANGLQGGNVKIGITADNVINISGDHLYLQTDNSSYKVNLNTGLVAAGDIETTAQNLSINSDSTEADSYVYLKGTGAYLKYNNTDNRIEINKNFYTTNNATIGKIDINATAGQIDTNGGYDLTLDSDGGTVYVNDMMVVEGSLTLTSNAIRSSTGNIAIGLSDTNVAVMGNLKVTGNNINSSTGSTVLTLNNTNAEFQGDVDIAGGDLTTSLSTFNLLNANATTVNFAGAATALALGATSGTTTVRNDLTVTGNLTVQGTTTTLNTQTVLIEDNILTLNSNVTGTPTTDGGIEIERGDSTNASIIWQETASPKQWYINNRTQIGGVLSVGGDLFTESGGNVYVDGAFLTLNNGNAATTCDIIIDRGTNDAILRWNETTDRWQTTVDGSTFINIPNQALDTTSSPVFASATIGKISINPVDGEINTVGSDLTLDSAGGHTYVKDDFYVRTSGSITKFFVDTANSRVGVNTATPAYTLDVDGIINTNNTVRCADVIIDDVATYNTQTTTTTSTSVTSISNTTRTTQKVVITITDDVTGDMHVLEALAFQHGSNAYLTTYGEMYTSAALATFTADVSAGSIRILATPASTNSTTFKVARVSVD